MKKVIAWEKWDADLIEQEIAEMLEVDDEVEELASDAMALMKKIPKLVSTPIGIFQLHDKANPIKQLDCWTGHTNFDITKSVQEKIEKIRGIELLMVLSRYRFFVGVGKLFDFKNVRHKLEKSICDLSKTKKKKPAKDDDMTQDVEDAVALIKNIISSDKYWAIYVSPEGEIDYASTNDANDGDYLETLFGYEADKEKFGGSIIQRGFDL